MECLCLGIEHKGTQGKVIICPQRNLFVPSS